jgi:murein L,D-transpeptidase YcbB/YkuD
MKRTYTAFTFFISCFLLLGIPNAGKASAKEALLVNVVLAYQKIPSFPPVPFDSTLIAPFFKKYPKFKSLKPQVIQLYRKHDYQFLWYDSRGRKEFANLLYDKVNNLDQEGLQIKVPYPDIIRALIQDSETAEDPQLESELLLSSLYFFYADKVFKGLDANKTRELEWYLPRKKQSYGSRLDSLLQDPTLINQPDKDLLGQYYQLKAALQDYRTIEQKGGWSSIVLPPKMKSLKLGDTAAVVLQIRNRLFTSGDLKKGVRWRALGRGCEIQTTACFHTGFRVAAKTHQGHEYSGKRAHQNPDGQHGALPMAFSEFD